MWASACWWLWGDFWHSFSILSTSSVCQCLSCSRWTVRWSCVNREGHRALCRNEQQCWNGIYSHMQKKKPKCKLVNKACINSGLFSSQRCITAHTHTHIHSLKHSSSFWIPKEDLEPRSRETDKSLDEQQQRCRLLCLSSSPWQPHCSVNQPSPRKQWMNTD